MLENTPELFTGRLILRRFTRQDIPALFEIYRDEQANTFLPWFPLKTLDQAEELFLRQYAAAYQKPQGYRYAICQKQDDIPIGYVHVGMEPAHDFGYGLRSDFWHQGFATEAGGGHRPAPAGWAALSHRDARYRQSPQRAGDAAAGHAVCLYL